MKINLTLSFLFLVSATSASSQAATASYQTTMAHQLMALTVAANSAEQIDELVEIDDRFNVMGLSVFDSPLNARPNMNFESLNVYQPRSDCSLKIQVANLQAISNDLEFRNRLSRIARRECLRQIDFKLNVHIEPDQIDLVRDAFTCAVSGTHAGYAATYEEHQVGTAGTIVQRRPILKDKVTTFDNRQTVVTSSAGRSPRVEFTCQIPRDPLSRQLEMNEFRRQWKSARISNITTAIVKFAERDQQVEDSRLQEARRQQVELDAQTSKLNRAVAIAARIETCLSRYRFADRYYRKIKIGASDSLSCNEGIEKFREGIRDGYQTVRSADLEAPCERQLKICEDWSVVGVLSEASVQAAPHVWKKIVETGKSTVDRLK